MPNGRNGPKGAKVTRGSIPVRRAAILACAAVAASSAMVVTPAQACAQAAAATVYLDGFQPEGVSERFYYGAEGGADVVFRVQRGGDTCGGESAAVRYDVVPHTATSGATDAEGDYDATGGAATGLQDPVHEDPAQSYRDVPVDLHADALVEPAVEEATVQLSEPFNAALAYPSSAPLYVVDDDGPARFSFAESLYGRFEGQDVSVPVFRAGTGLASQVGFTVAPGGTDPADAGDDYVAPASGTLTFAPGQRVAAIDVSLEQDRLLEGTETIDVTLTAPGDDARVATTIRIDDDDDGIVLPTSKLHHPKHGWTYGPQWNGETGMALLDEIHIFVNLQRDSTIPVGQVEMALRKRMRSGACSWWNGDGFTQGRCKRRQWISEGVERFASDPNFWYYRFDRKLRPSVGTSIRDYTMYSRAVDEGGNVEPDLDVGRNANTFDVAPRG